jgi:3D (Asp-Asp-Asp) domain-containing protein
MRTGALGAACAAPLAIALLGPIPGHDHAGASELRELEVVATAYNSLAAQTGPQPRLTAWGDRLKPGMKAIAVSRDLVELGLTHGVEVEIRGFEGRYVVRDKMADRWRRKIDIYMGEDVEAARSFGRQRVKIRWTPR